MYWKRTIANLPGFRDVQRDAFLNPEKIQSLYKRENSSYNQTLNDCYIFSNHMEIVLSAQP